VEADWDRVFRLASLNRVLYVFARNLRVAVSIPKPPLLEQNLDEVVTGGDKWLSQLKDTLEFVNDTFSRASIPYLCVKTARELPYVTFDVDILVKPDDFEGALEALQKAGAQTRPYTPKEQTDAELAGLLRIDLHHGFYWRNSEYISSDLMWEDPREVEIQQVSCPVPSLNAELALMVAHCIHERFHIPLLELLFLKKASHKVDGRVMLEQAQKHGWDKSARGFVSIVNELGAVTFGDQEPLLCIPGAAEARHIPTGARLEGTVSMPFMFPFSFSASIFWERLLNKRSLSLFDAGYYLLFSNARYYYTRKLRVPMYGHWFPLEQLKWDKTE
jgi:hypothetical protein